MVDSEDVLIKETLKKKIIDIICHNSTQIDPIPTEEKEQLLGSGKIKSIIFDIYGTLLISASGDIGTVKNSSKSETFLNSLQKCGITVIDANAGKKGLEYLYQGIQLSHIASKKKGIEYPEVLITEIWEIVISKLKTDKMIEVETTDNISLLAATYFECSNNPVWPMPDLVEVLGILKKENIVLGIISNAQFYTPLLFPAITGFSLRELGFDSKLIQFSYEKKEAKPSLLMFKTVMKALKSKYDIGPSNTLYIGNDMLNDIYSAKMAGMKTALFAGDARSLRLRETTPQVSGIKPDFTVTKLIQIPALLKKSRQNNILGRNS
jgi:putative hydrolase of the HAD superfamily